MNANDLTTIDQVRAFMSGTQREVFEVAGDQQGRYDWVRRTLVKFDYSGCGKADRGVLISYLEQLLEMFPFVIRGFHADNGSEYINRRVARLLEKLRIEFTKSRARHSNDNALVECKNGHVVRKLLGHAHIPQRWAGLLNDFHRQHLNPYVNYHRPCLFPQTVTDKTGKQRKRYPYESLMTPYEKLKSIADAKTYLKPGLSFAILDDVAYRISDNAAADALQQARRTLFTTIYEQEQKRA